MSAIYGWRGRLRRRTLCLALALPLAACGHLQVAGDADLDQAEPQVVRPDLATVQFLNDAVAPVAVSRVRQGPWLVERLVLPNDTALPYENRIVVKTRWRGAGVPGFLADLPEQPFARGEIATLAAREFAGGTVSEPRMAHNRNGDYAYVEASFAGGPTCIYAWQVIDAVARRDGVVHGYALEFRHCAVQGGGERLRTVFDHLKLEPEA